MKKNCLNIEITRPNQKLIIMRGVPGSGKSTEANNRVLDGVIHSTDDLIEATGDYAGHFTKMVEGGDWSEHSRMHGRNFGNARRSMEDGISPVVIDNTNIKASEAKKYIEAALKMGFDENNITFVEVGDGGCTAEVLAERNTHNVPLETIERMLQSIKGVGPLTVKKVLKSKDMFKAKKIAMLVLDKDSSKKLKVILNHKIPEGWTPFCHHMTINFGKGLTGDMKDLLGAHMAIRATHIGISDMCIAVKVEGCHTDNDIPHVTVAVNKEEGGKPVMSNKITNWVKMENYINMGGIITEEKLN